MKSLELYSNIVFKFLWSLWIRIQISYSIKSLESYSNFYGVLESYSDF